MKFHANPSAFSIAGGPCNFEKIEWICFFGNSDFAEFGIIGKVSLCPSFYILERRDPMSLRPSFNHVSVILFGRANLVISQPSL